LGLRLNLSSGDYSGDFHATTNAGDYVDFVFFGHGSQRNLPGDTKWRKCGLLFGRDLSGDCQRQPPRPAAAQTLFFTNNLSVQNHNLRLVNNGGPKHNGGCFVIQGIPEIIVNDDEPVYDHVPTDWTYSSGRDFGDYHSDVTITQNNGEYVQYTFVGPSIVWIGETENSEGVVSVYLDGIFQTNVNCFSTTRITQQRLFTATNLSPGRHSLKLVKTSGSYLGCGRLCGDAHPARAAGAFGVERHWRTNQIGLSWNASVGATGLQSQTRDDHRRTLCNVAGLAGTKSCRRPDSPPARTLFLCGMATNMQR